MRFVDRLECTTTDECHVWLQQTPSLVSAYATNKTWHSSMTKALQSHKKKGSSIYNSLIGGRHTAANEHVLFSLK